MTTKTAKKHDELSGADSQPEEQTNPHTPENNTPEHMPGTIQDSAARSLQEAATELVQEHTPDPDLQLREIRELLFGSQVRQVNADITTRYKQVTEQISALTRQMENTFTRLSHDFNSKLDDFAAHLEDLNRQRVNREGDLSADIDDLRQKLSEATLAAEQTDGDIRHELHSEADRLKHELEQRHSEAMSRINQTSDELSNNKTDRKTLAALLENMASNLTAGEPK